MATESDVPLSVSSTDKEGMDRYVTGTDLDQPFKANQLAQSEEIATSSSLQVETAISDFQGKAELPQGEYFSEPPSAVKLATKQRVEGYQMDDVPGEVDEEMHVNGKMIQKDSSTETPEVVGPEEIPVCDPNDAAEEKVMIGEGRDLPEIAIPTLKQEELHFQSDGERNLTEATILEQIEADAKGQSSPQMNAETGRMIDNEAEVAEDFSLLEPSTDFTHVPHSTVSELETGGQNIAEPTGEFESEDTLPDKEDTPEQDSIGEDATGEVEQKDEKDLHFDVNEIVEGKLESLPAAIATDVPSREASILGKKVLPEETETSLEMASDAPVSNENMETTSSAAVDCQGGQEPNIAEVSPDKHEDEKDATASSTVKELSFKEEEIREDKHEEKDATASSTVNEFSFKEEEIREDRHYDGVKQGTDETGDVPSSILNKEVMPEETNVHASSDFVEPTSHSESDTQPGNQEGVKEERDDRNTETSLEMASEEADAPVSNEHIETISSAEDFQQESQEPNLAEVSLDKHEEEKLERSLKTAVPEEVDAPASSTIEELSFKEEEIGEDKHHNGATEGTDEIGDVPASILSKEVIPEEMYVHAARKFVEPISHDELDSQEENQEGLREECEDRKTEISMEIALVETDAPASNENIETISSAAVDLQEGSQETKIGDVPASILIKEVLPEEILVHDPNDAAEENVKIGEGQDLPETAIPTLKQQELHLQSEGERNLMEATILEQIETDAKGKSSDGGMQKNVEDEFSTPKRNAEAGRMIDNEAEVVEDFGLLEPSTDFTHAPHSTVSEMETGGQNIAEPTGEFESEDTAPDKEDTPEQEIIGQNTTEGVEQKDEKDLHFDVNEVVEGKLESLPVTLATDVSSREAAGPPISEQIDAPASSKVDKLGLKEEEIREDKHSDGVAEGTDEVGDVLESILSKEVLPEEAYMDASSKFLEPISHDELDSQAENQEGDVGKCEDPKTETSLEMASEETDAPASNKHIQTISSASVDFHEGSQEPKFGDAPASILSKEVLPDETYVDASSEFVESISHDELDSQAENQEGAVEECEDSKKEASLEMATEEMDAPASHEHIDTISCAAVGFQEESQEPNTEEVSPDKHEDEKLENSSKTVHEEKDATASSTVKGLSFEEEEIREDKHYDGATEGTGETGDVEPEETYVHATSKFVEPISHAELDSQAENQEGVVEESEDLKTETSAEIASEETDVHVSNEHNETISSAGVDLEEGCQEPNLAEALPDKHANDNLERSLKSVPEGIDAPASSTIEERSLDEEERIEGKHNDGVTESTGEIADVPASILHEELVPEETCVHASSKFMEPISHAESDPQEEKQEGFVEECEDQKTETSLEMATKETDAPASKEHIETISSAEIDFQEGSREPNIAEVSPDKPEDEKLETYLKPVLEVIDAPASGNYIETNSAVEDDFPAENQEGVSEAKQKEEIVLDAGVSRDEAEDEKVAGTSEMALDVEKTATSECTELAESKDDMIQESEALIKEEIQPHSSTSVPSDILDLSREEYKEEKTTEEELKPEIIEENRNQELSEETEEKGCSGNSEAEKVNEDDFLSESKENQVDEIIRTTEDDIATKDNSVTLTRVTGDEDCIPENKEDVNNSSRPEEQVKDSEESMKNEDQMGTEVKTEEELVSNDMVEQNVGDITEEEMKTEEMEKVRSDTQVDDLNEGIRRPNTWAQNTDNISEQCDEQEKVITSEEDEKQEEPELGKSQDILEEQSKECMGEGSTEKSELNNKATDFTLLSEPEKVNPRPDNTRSIKLGDMTDNVDQEEVDKSKTSPDKEFSNLEDEAPSRSRSNFPDTLENVQVENAATSGTDLEEQCATEKTEELFEGRENQEPQTLTNEDQITETEENLVPAKYSDNPQDAYLTERTEQRNEATTESNATGTERKMDDNIIQSYVEKVPEESEEGQHVLGQEEELKLEDEEKTEEIQNEDKTIKAAILTEEELKEAKKVVSEDTIESDQGDNTLTRTAEGLPGSCNRDESDADIEVKETAEANTTGTERTIDDNIIQSHVEKVPEESQEGQHELGQGEELMLEVEDQTEEIQNEDETIKATNLTEEELTVAAKVVSEETIESAQGDKTNAPTTEELKDSCNGDKSDAAMEVKETTETNEATSETNPTETERKIDHVLNQSYVDKISEESQEGQPELDQEEKLEPEVGDQTEEIHNEEETLKAAILTEEEQEAEKIFSEETIESAQGEKTITSSAKDFQGSYNEDESDAAIKVKETSETNEATSETMQTETKRKIDDVLNQSYLDKDSEESQEGQHELDQDEKLKPEVEDQTEEIHNEEETLEAATLTEEGQEADKAVSEETTESAQGEKTITSTAGELQGSCNEDESDATIEVKETAETNEATSETIPTETERKIDDVMNESYVDKVPEESQEGQHELDQEEKLKPEVEDQTKEIHSEEETLKAAILTEEGQEADKAVSEDTIESAQGEKTITGTAEELQASCNEDGSDAAIEVKETSETNDATFETNATETERNIDDFLNQRYVEKDSEKSQEGQHDQEEELKPEVEDHTAEIQNEDEAIKAAILTEEEDQEAEKVVSEETVKSAQGDKDITSTAEELQGSFNRDKSDAAIEVKETVKTNDTTSETDATETERKIDDVLDESYVEKVSEESQEGQHELDREEELKPEVHNEDENIKAVILTEEEQKEDEKVFSGEATESSQGDYNITSAAEEWQGSCNGDQTHAAIEVKETAALSVTDVSATCSVEQTKTNNNEIQEEEKQPPVTETVDEEKVEDEGTEKPFKVSTIRAAKEPTELRNKEIVEEVSANSNERKETSLAEGTYTTSLEDIQNDNRPEQISNINSDESTQFAVEGDASEKDHMMLETLCTSSSIVVSDPSTGYHQNVANERNVLASAEESGKIEEMTDLEHEPRDQSVEEIDSSQTTTSGKDTSGVEAITEKESTVTTEPESSDIASKIQAEETCEQTEESTQLEGFQMELASESCLISNPNEQNEESKKATEVVGEQILKEEKLKDQHQMSSNVLPREHGYSIEVDTHEKNIKEVGTEEEPEAVEESCLHIEDSRLLEVSQSDPLHEENVVEEVQGEGLSSESKSTSNLDNAGEVEEERVSCIQTLPLEKSEETHQLSTSQEEGKENSGAIESIEETMMAAKALKDSPITTEEAPLQKELKDQELHQFHDTTHEDVCNLREEKPEEQHVMLNEHGESAKFQEPEQNVMGVEVPEEKPKATEEPSLQTEERDLASEANSVGICDVSKIIGRVDEGDETRSIESAPVEKSEELPHSTPSEEEHGISEITENIDGNQKEEVKSKAQSVEDKSLRTEELRELESSMLPLQVEGNKEEMTEEKNEREVSDNSCITYSEDIDAIGVDNSGLAPEMENLKEHSEKPSATALFLQEQKHEVPAITEHLKENAEEAEFLKNESKLEVGLSDNDAEKNDPREARKEEDGAPGEAKGEERETSELPSGSDSHSIAEIMDDTLTSKRSYNQETGEEVFELAEGDNAYKLAAESKESEIIEKHPDRETSKLLVEEECIKVTKTTDINQNDVQSKEISEEKEEANKSHQEHKPVAEGGLGSTEFQKEEVQEIEQVNFTETTKNLSHADISSIEFPNQVTAENQDIKERFAGERQIEENKIMGVENVLNLESQRTDTISDACKTETMASAEKESRDAVPTKECSTITHKEIQQGDRAYYDGNKMQRPEEEELFDAKEPKISTEREQAPEVPKDLGAANSAEAKAGELGTKEILDDKEQHADAHKETESKHSLFDMMHRSTKVTEATRELSEFEETVVMQEAFVQVEAGKSEKHKSDEEKDDEEEDEAEEGEEHKKADSSSDGPVMVEAHKDMEIKTPNQKKSHNILSGMGSKVKHSISKVKKAITGKSSHSKQHSPK